MIAKDRILSWYLIPLLLHVYLAICGGYVPEKYQALNTKTAILAQSRLILAKNSSFPSLFGVFTSTNNQFCKFKKCEQLRPPVFNNCRSKTKQVFLYRLRSGPMGDTLLRCQFYHYFMSNFFVGMHLCCTFWMLFFPRKEICIKSCSQNVDEIGYV